MRVLGRYGRGDGPARRAPRRATAVAALLLAGAVAVGGCGAPGNDEAGGAAVEHKGLSEDRGGDRGAVAEEGPRSGARQDGGQSAPSAEADRDGGGGTSDTAKAATRHVVHTASLTVRTRDVPGGLAEARAAVESAGGYVGEETTDRDEDGDERSRATFRVPPEEYDDVLGTLAGLGKLTKREVSTDDVTEQVVDVESRIDTQQASVARIRELMDEATQLSDVVTLESELSTRQANLESLQAQLESLEERTGMATITLVLEEPDAKSEDDDEDGPSVPGALSGGWHAFVSMLLWIVAALGAALPFLATAALLFALWRVVSRRLPGRPRPHTPAPPPAPVTTPAPLTPDPDDAPTTH